MREKGSKPWGEISQRVTGSSRRRGNYYQDILYEEMIYFQQREKMKNCHDDTDDPNNPTVLQWVIISFYGLREKKSSWLDDFTDKYLKE